MKTPCVAAMVALLAGPALAHTGHGDIGGFLHGLAHPVLGADHLLAMLAVGLWSGFVHPARYWAGPAVFLAAMLLGGGLSWVGIGFPMVETVIVASVVGFGLMTLVARRGQAAGVTGISLAVIAVFATAHGHAHASEAVGNALAYLAGFVASTAALHAAGVLVARTIATRPIVQRTIGAGIAVSGFWLLLG